MTPGTRRRKHETAKTRQETPLGSSSVERRLRYSCHERPASRICQGSTPNDPLPMSARWLPLSDLMDLIRLLHKTSANCPNTLNCPAGPPDCRGDTGNRH